jgi:soluble lytic murein transglycosylase-like protein
VCLHKVIELRGTVNGSIRREHSVAFLLMLEDKRAILLNAPTSDVRIVSEVNNQTVRVLARVTDGIAGNVVPLEVLGVAYDGEVTLRERAAEQRLAAETQRAQYRQLASRPRTEPASRGGYYARPMHPAASGGVSALAARYLRPEAQAVYPYYRDYIARCNPRLAAKEVDDITVSLLYFSQHNQVDPRLVVAMIIAESDFDPHSTSSKGAMGLGQIMPDEARDHGLTNPYDPIQNVRAAVNLLKMKLNLYDEGAPPGQTTLRQRMLALAAYNAGAVKRYGYRVPPYHETQRYVDKVMRIYNELTGNSGT